MADSLRRDIAELTSLLAVLEYYRYEELDVATYPPSKSDRAGFLESAAKVLSTADSAVAIAGGFKSAKHLQFVIAVEEDHHDRGPTRSDSEVTLVGTPEIKDDFKADYLSGFLSPPSPGDSDGPSIFSTHDSITHFIRTHLTPQKMAQRDARHLLIKERASEIRQKIVSSDVIFPYHTSGFREIFCAWHGVDASRDYSLLPKEGITFTVKASGVGAFIAQVVAGVWDPTKKTVLFTNANLPRWINGLGLLLGYTYLAFGNPAAEPNDLFFLVEVLYVLKGLFESEHLRLVFTKSSLAAQLKTCYEAAHPIGPHDSSAHEHYPLPSCTRRLVLKYLNGIVEIAVHAKNLYHSRLYHDDLDDLIVDVVYLNTQDGLSEPTSTLEDVLTRYVPDLDKDSEQWFLSRSDQLQAYVTAVIHPEAAITCMKRAHLKSELDDVMDAQVAEIVSLASSSSHVGMSRKMCYCCAIVDAWTSLDAGAHLAGMHPLTSHGRILPWLPPPYGLSRGRLEALKRDLMATLDLLVWNLRDDEEMMRSIVMSCEVLDVDDSDEEREP